MLDETPQPLPEPPHENLPIAPEVIAPQSKKTSKNLWIIAIVTFGVLCLCSVICISVVVFGALKVNAEKAPIGVILDTFMKDMVANDAESAYALFSPRMKRQIPISKIQEMLEGNNYVLFEGYQSLSVQNLNINAVANTNPDVPQGTVAKVTGLIEYEGGMQGTFNATLEKVDGKWQVDGMYITVPPSKFKP
jgi:hypothetical protein